MRAAVREARLQPRARGAHLPRRLHTRARDGGQGLDTSQKPRDRLSPCQRRRLVCVCVKRAELGAHPWHGLTLNSSFHGAIRSPERGVYSFDPPLRSLHLKPLETLVKTSRTHRVSPNVAGGGLGVVAATGVVERATGCTTA